LAERLPPLLPDGDLISLVTSPISFRSTFVVVLRVPPIGPKGELEARGWSPSKVQENVEAEALDVILMEALDSGHETVEVDTTGRSPSRTVEALEEILAGESDKYAVGHVDWSQEILGWY
jgi:adenylate kinase